MLDENMIFFKEEFTTHVFLCEKYVTWFSIISITNFYSGTSKIFFSFYTFFFFKKIKSHQKNNTFQVQGLLEKTGIWD